MADYSRTQNATVPTYTSAGVAASTVAWANSDPANTEKTLDITDPFGAGQGPRPDTLLIVVRNPSSVTALTIAVKNKYTDPNGSTTRYAKLTSFTAAVVGTTPDDGGEAFLVDGATLGQGCRLSIKNVTVLGGSDAFTASVLVYRL